MTALAKAIQERLVELGWQQKMLAHEWCQRVGKGSGATYETRLSKLVNDDQEGYDFVLDDKEDRLSALAGVLDWTPEKLRSLIDAALVSTTLILHPALPEAVAAFLLKRQESGAHKCTQVDGADSNGGVREVLKDAAKSVRNAFVVIPDSSRDHDFFEGAGVRTTRVEPANPGYKLVALPDLIQPLAPKLHDDDGMPMVPDQAIEQSYRESLNPASRDPYGRPRERPSEDDPCVRAIREADAEGRLVTFRLESVQRRYGWQPSPEQVKTRALQDAFERVFPERAKERSSYHSHEKRQEEQWVWAKGRAVLILGPETAAVKAIAKHHQLLQVESFEPLVAALAKVTPTLNPDGDGGTLDLARELEAFEAEAGIALDIQMSDVRKVLAPNGPARFADGESVRVSPEADQSVRALLDDILAREFILPNEQAPTVFLLQAIRSAPLAHVADKNSVSVLADIGAGWLMRFDATTFNGEEPGPVRMVNWDRYSRTGTFDGGNIRFSLKPVFEQQLEGSVLRSVGRRRDEEAARAADDD
ncbi:MAG: hypothetical protein HS104_16890 [Polyangiaceae bacterium]|nr:hypothetical protein [Polyangiaceae bacterium]